MNTPINNWNSTVTFELESSRNVTARDLAHLIAIVKDPDDQYPGPLRAVGSRHSLNECFTTTGTLIRMDNFKDNVKGMYRPRDGEITVGAGVTMLELRNALEKAELQIEVVPEIGNATAGSVACCGTKDASLGPNWPGQISSTVIGVGMVDAHGNVVRVTAAADLQRLKTIRSSYGLLGIVFEVTFRTIPRQRLRYEYEPLDLTPLPTIDRVLHGPPAPPGARPAEASGFLGFLMPYSRKLVVERRTPVDGKSPVLNPLPTFRRWTRDFAWKHIGNVAKLPVAARDWLPELDSKLLGFFDKLGRFDAWAGASMIDFKEEKHAFDFAFWAFPADTWETAIPEYLTFCEKFLQKTKVLDKPGFRSALPTEVYFMRKDRQDNGRDDSALLSVCPDKDVFTLDLVDLMPRSGDDEKHWQTMNAEFNEFAASHGARPLLNQTKFLTGPGMARLRQKWPPEIGQSWAKFERLRHEDDPDDRFLTSYFRALLQPGDGPSQTESPVTTGRPDPSRSKH